MSFNYSYLEASCSGSKRSYSEILRLCIRALPLTLPADYCLNFVTNKRNVKDVEKRISVFSLLPELVPDVLQTRLIIRQPKVRG